MGNEHGRESDSRVATAIETPFNQKNGKLWVRIRKSGGDNASRRATYGYGQSLRALITGES